jgi:hypothetical protein
MEMGCFFSFRESVESRPEWGWNQIALSTNPNFTPEYFESHPKWELYGWYFVESFHHSRIRRKKSGFEMERFFSFQESHEWSGKRDDV